MNAVSQILGALIEAWGEVKVQKARVVLSLVGVVAAVAAMTIVIALGDLLLQSSRELAELYEGRSVTLRLTPESSSNASEGPAAGGPYQDASDPASATGAQTAKRPDEKDTLGEAMGTLAERTDIHYWSRFSSGGGDIVETRQARSSGQFRGYPLTNIGDMVDGVTFQGVDPSYEVIFRTRMLAGRWVVSSDADQRLVPVVISETLWNQLGRAPIDQVPIVLHTSEGTAMRVVGITKSKSSYDMPTVFAHYDAARISFPQMSSPSMIAWVGTENADQARENLPRALASILGEGWRVSVSGGEHEDIGEEQLGTISNVYARSASAEPSAPPRRASSSRSSWSRSSQPSSPASSAWASRSSSCDSCPSRPWASRSATPRPSPPEPPSRASPSPRASAPCAASSRRSRPCVSSRSTRSATDSPTRRWLPPGTARRRVGAPASSVNVTGGA